MEKKEAPPAGYKRCNRCLVSKPIESFSRSKRSKDGRCYYCKECANSQQRALYERRAKEAIQAGATNHRRHRKKIQFHDVFTNEIRTFAGTPGAPKAGLFQVKRYDGEIGLKNVDFERYTDIDLMRELYARGYDGALMYQRPELTETERISDNECKFCRAYR